MGLHATFYDKNKKPIAYHNDADWPGPELEKVYLAKSNDEFVRKLKALVRSGEESFDEKPEPDANPKEGGAVYFSGGKVKIYYDGKLQGPAAEHNRTQQEPETKEPTKWVTKRIHNESHGFDPVKAKSDVASWLADNKLAIGMVVAAAAGAYALAPSTADAATMTPEQRAQATLEARNAADRVAAMKIVAGLTAFTAAAVVVFVITSD